MLRTLKIPPRSLLVEIHYSILGTSIDPYAEKAANTRAASLRPMFVIFIESA